MPLSLPLPFFTPDLNALSSFQSTFTSTTTSDSHSTLQRTSGQRCQRTCPRSGHYTCNNSVPDSDFPTHQHSFHSYLLPFNMQHYKIKHLVFAFPQMYSSNFFVLCSDCKANSPFIHLCLRPKDLYSNYNGGLVLLPGVTES